MDSVDKQIQTLSVIVSRMNLAARMGKAYDNSRDLFQALGYPPNIEYDDLLARYCRQDIVRAVVDKPVKATWRNGFKLVETEDADETPFEKEWADLSLKLRIPSIFTRLDRLCAFGDYGVLLLGFDDVTALEEFAQPVQSGKRRLNYLRPFGQANAVIQQWETDPNNERYGLPVTYQITTAAPGTSSTSTALVHYSRVLHVAEDLLESDVQGLSRLEPIYNRFMDLEKLVGGSAEMFWRGARPGYQGKIDPDYTMTSETKDDLKSQIDEFEHNLRRILVNEGIDLTSLQQQIADPASHVDVQLQMISAVTGIPKRILVGSERGELSSSQDQDAWADLITNRREDFVEPCIIRPFVERVCLYGVISSPADMTYDIEWPSMYESSDQEKAQVGATRATALKDYCSNPNAEAVVPPKAFFQFFLGFEEEDIELIEQMVEEGMTKEEAAMKQIGVTPEQVDAIKNPQPVPVVQPTVAQPKKASPAEPQTHSFPGHAGRPGQVGGSSPRGAGAFQKLEEKDLFSMGFYLEEYQKNALAEGRHEIISAPVKKAFGTEYDEWGGLKDTDERVQSMRETLQNGYRLMVPEGSRQADGRVRIIDGQHRLLAYRLERGENSYIPVLVLKNDLQIDQLSTLSFPGQKNDIVFEEGE